MAKKFLIVAGGTGEFVLGQMKILGLNGEIQVDVKGELDDTNNRLMINDPQHLSVRADEGATNLMGLFAARDLIGKDRNWDSKINGFADFIIENWMGNPAVSDGLAQSPTVGGFAIHNRKARIQFEKALKKLLSVAVANEDLEFWMISSTSGGTGEGTHRALAEYITDVVRKGTYGSLKIKFIRIGPSTYQEIAGQRAEIATFFGLAADARLQHAMNVQYGPQSPTIYWYYVDLPDYGPGDDIKPVRGSIVELASKALMLDELSADLDQVAVNGNTMIVRTGYWGREYEDNDLYFAALDGLLKRIELQVNPGESIIAPERSLPRFDPKGLTEFLEVLSDRDKLIEKIENGWQIEDRPFPGYLMEVEGFLGAMEDSLEKLFGRSVKVSYMQPRPEYRITADRDGTAEQQTFEMASGKEESGTKQWFKDYRTAQSVFAWAIKLMGVRVIIQDAKGRNKSDWYMEVGLLRDLFDSYTNVKKVFSWSPLKNADTKANNLSRELRQFLDVLTKVRLLFDELVKANEVLKRDTKKFEVLKSYAQERMRNIRLGSPQEAPIVVAELDDVLDRLNNLTWFKLVHKEASLKHHERFERAVMRGAVGLTELGLKEVLRLDSGEGVEAIRRELRNNVGRMYDPFGNETAALWFSGMNPGFGTIMDFKYRLLPKMEAGFDLGPVRTDSGISYKYPPVGVLGLKVLAMECVTVAQPGDAVSTHAMLIAPYVNAVRSLLEDWPVHQRGLDSHRFRIATSAVLGDAISYEVLEAAGLSKDEIKKLEEYLLIEKF